MPNRTLQLLCYLPLMVVAVRQRALDMSTTAATSNGLPPRKSNIKGAEKVCPKFVGGTLVVGCVSAAGLENTVLWTPQHYPYCRVRISDMSKMEERGWGDKKKGTVVTEELHTKVKRLDSTPDWNEAFAIDMTCPSLPDAYELQITAKNDLFVKDTTFGYVYLPLKDIIFDSPSDGSPRSWTLRTSDRSDPDVKRNSSKTIKISHRFCSFGDNYGQCVQEAVEKAGAKAISKNRATVGDCGQGCHSVLAGAMSVHTKSIVDDLVAAADAENKEEVKDYALLTGGWHTSTEDGMTFPAYMAKHWQEAGEKLEKLASAMSAEAEKLCGSHVATAVREAVIQKSPASRPGSKFKSPSWITDGKFPKDPDAPEKETSCPSCRLPRDDRMQGAQWKEEDLTQHMGQVDAYMTWLSQELKQRWRKGEVNPKLDDLAVPKTCMDYFQK